jgi:hypothetical protein
MCQRLNNSPSFRITACYDDNRADIFNIESDYFSLFIQAMIEFFDTGIVPVPKEQTIDVIAVREAGFKAFETPYKWIEV